MDDARLFLCARCRRHVLICSRCNRGQQYCGASCSDRARRESMRAAGRRYQHSRRGWHCHAERQRRYRRRRRDGGWRDASGFRSVAMRCSTPTPTSSQARGEPCDVLQASHRASLHSERHFRGALPLLRTSDQRVRASSLATFADRPASSRRRTALNAPYDGDQRRTQPNAHGYTLSPRQAGARSRIATRRRPRCRGVCATRPDRKESRLGSASRTRY